MRKIQWIPLLLSLFLSLGTGLFSGLLTMDSMEQFAALNKPPFAPPAWLFPVVWTALYFLMGISAYLIWTEKKPEKNSALILYGLQLFVNFFWTIIFFNFNAYLTAFFWLLLLWFLVMTMIRAFRPLNEAAALLQIPYFLWLTFAAFLNFAIWLLNP